MTATDELTELKQVMCSHHRKDDSCTNCPFYKDGCMINREIGYLMAMRKGE